MEVFAVAPVAAVGSGKQVVGRVISAVAAPRWVGVVAAYRSPAATAPGLVVGSCSLAVGTVLEHGRAPTVVACDDVRMLSCGRITSTGSA